MPRGCCSLVLTESGPLEHSLCFRLCRAPHSSAPCSNEAEEYSIRLAFSRHVHDNVEHGVARQAVPLANSLTQSVSSRITTLTNFTIMRLNLGRLQPLTADGAAVNEDGPRVSMVCLCASASEVRASCPSVRPTVCPSVRPSIRLVRLFVSWPAGRFSLYDLFHVRKVLTERPRHATSTLATAAMVRKARDKRTLKNERF